MATDDSDVEDEFWDDVAAFEQREHKSLFDVLTESGIFLPAPDELDDAQLTKKLWDVIHALAQVGTFLHSTNHLSDRQLYTELWSDVFHDPVVLIPDNPDYACHLDMIGTGSEEHIALYLKYYADEEERRRWREEWPSEDIPEHEDPPYDRDLLLPQAEDRRAPLNPAHHVM